MEAQISHPFALKAPIKSFMLIHQQTSQNHGIPVYLQAYLPFSLLKLGSLCNSCTTQCVILRFTIVQCFYGYQFPGRTQGLQLISRLQRWEKWMPWRECLVMFLFFPDFTSKSPGVSNPGASNHDLPSSSFHQGGLGNSICFSSVFRFQIDSTTLIPLYYILNTPFLLILWTHSSSSPSEKMSDLNKNNFSKCLLFNIYSNLILI